MREKRVEKSAGKTTEGHLRRIETKLEEASKDEAWQDRKSQGKARRVKAGQGKVRRDETRHNKARLEEKKREEAKREEKRQGEACRGVVAESWRSGVGRVALITVPSNCPRWRCHFNMCALRSPMSI